MATVCKNSNLICYVCKREVGTAHKCSICNNYVHIFCGKTDEEDEGYGQTVECEICLEEKQNSISNSNESQNKLKRKGDNKEGGWGIFKRTHKHNNDVFSSKKPKRVVKEYVCLRCGATVVRGNELYFKRRHWESKHNKEDLSLAQLLIVPADHEDARKILKNKSKDLIKVKSQVPLLEVGMEKPQPVKHLPDVKVDVSTTTKARIGQDIQQNIVQVKNREPKAQQSITNSLEKGHNNKEKEMNNQQEKDRLAGIENEIGKLNIMLTALTLQKEQRSGGEKVTYDNGNSIAEAKNLSDIDCSDVSIEILDDGCVVTCNVCKAFIESHPSKIRAHAQQDTWSNGMHYDAAKRDLLLSGSNQTWYSLKQAIKEHLNCASKRSGGQVHLAAKKFALSEKKKETKRLNTNSNVVATALEACKVKSAANSFETLLSLVAFCGGEIGDIGHGRNLFPEIISAAYQYILMKTSAVLKKELPSTGMRPHFSIAIDKSTPHRDTNHAILIILPSNGKRIAVPIDAPLVYDIDNENNIEGGSGRDLADQVVEVLKKDLEMDLEDLSYMRCVHADGQYQASTFQETILKLSNDDPFFLLPWDVAHWIDRVMEKLREKIPETSSFLSRLIKRSNKFHIMFGHGKGHREYRSLSKSLGAKCLEIGTFATTRFFSSAFQQWERILESYPALIKTFSAYRERHDDGCDETKYEIRGQDFILDLLGIVDILSPVAELMTKCQTVNLPPWKIAVWFPKVIVHLNRAEQNLKNVINNGDDISEVSFPRLEKHWENLTNEESPLFEAIELLPGWIVTNQTTTVVNKKKNVTYEWTARSTQDCLNDLLNFVIKLTSALEEKFEDVVPVEIK